MKINLIASMVMIGTLLILVVNQSSFGQSMFDEDYYDPESPPQPNNKEIDPEIKFYIDNCTELDYLANFTNIKIINMLQSKTIKEPCIDKIDQFLGQGFTIKGILQDKFMVLEKEVKN